ncbi:MAG: hypothetical protein ACTSRS_12740 [Candidatus Helarchaeota archaeon]
MALNMSFLAVAVIIGAITLLAIFLWVFSKRRITSLKQVTKPPPKTVTIGPKLTKDQQDDTFRGIDKSRGLRGIGDMIIPIAVKSVVGFYDTVYIGDTYAVKIYLFNTSKNAEQADVLINGILDKDAQKKFETDTLYAKDQDPVKLKVQVLGPNFIITPESRIVEIPAGALIVSTHLVSPKTDMTMIGKSQTLLINFNQILEEGDTIDEMHLGSIDFHVNLEKSIIPEEVESEIKTQEKIRYISSAAGAATAILTVVTTILALLGI